MDLSRIRKALQEAGGTSATAGPGAIGGGIAQFKAPMGVGDWREQNEEIDPQSPGVVQSTQHASDAQLINPWAGKLSEVTHEEVNLFEGEERIDLNKTPLKPFSGLQMEDFEVGINDTFKEIEKAIHYNIANISDSSNKDVHKLKDKYNTLKNIALMQIKDSIDRIQNEKTRVLTDYGINPIDYELNLSDIFLVQCLMNAYSNDEEVNPLIYADKQAERLLQIAKDDAIELATHLYKTLIPKLKSSKSSKLGIAYETIDAINKEHWGEALVWNKLRKTLDVIPQGNDDEEDFDTDLPKVEPEEIENTEEEPQLVEDANQGYPGSISRIGINPTQPSGLESKAIMPLQGTNTIHEEELPKTTINPLQLGDIIIQGYNVVEDGKPTLLRYKLIKNNIALPVDVEKKNSKNIGHTKEQILKKLSLMPKKYNLLENL